MNEQQLADLFSEQIDRMLIGEDVSLPAEAAELNDLLSLGGQLSQTQFTASTAATAAFYGQLATWFGAKGVSTATVLGIPKVLFSILLVTGTGLALLVVGAVTYLNFADTSAPTQAPTVPKIIQPRETEPAEELEQQDESTQPAATDVLPPPKKSSEGETLNQPKPSSQGDTLKVAPSPTLQSTVAVTATTPATDTTTVTGTGIDDDSSSGDGGAPGQDGARIEDDRGHGNDPGGYDPDNPGNSTGVGGPSLSRGSDGGSSSGGGSGNSSGGNGSQNNQGKKNKK